LNGLRERWLNPPEWTVETILEFPAGQRHPARLPDRGAGAATRLDRRAVPGFRLKIKNIPANPVT
jgi:hypothetical protein